jgi:Tripartite tricarboxylate transporter family receptor
MVSALTALRSQSISLRGAQGRIVQATVGEFVPGYEVSQWYGLDAPRNTPAEIVDNLNKEINAALADPKLKARLAGLGAEVLAGKHDHAH